MHVGQVITMYYIFEIWRVLCHWNYNVSPVLQCVTDISMSLMLQCVTDIKMCDFVSLVYQCVTNITLCHGYTYVSLKLQKKYWYTPVFHGHPLYLSGWYKSPSEQLSHCIYIYKSGSILHSKGTFHTSN